MIIKNASLETVCGYTSKLPKNTKAGDRICRKIKCGKIISDQRPDEPQGTGPHFRSAGQDTDHQFL